MIRFICFAISFLFLVVRPAPAFCFYFFQTGDSKVELNGFFGGGIGQLTYPSNSPFYDVRDDRIWSGDLRIMAEADSDDFHLSSNILQSTRSKISYANSFSGLLPKDTERSASLTWEQHESVRVRSELVVDTLHLQYRSDRLDLTAGRQPINLATTFYYTPNDFFAPFAPQTFFRNYKPGVDGARADLRLANLSQFTLLAVLAYERDFSTANGWSREPDWAETSLLMRFSRESFGFGWSLLAGSVKNSTISGVSLQGELFNGIGLRTEGHYSAPESGNGGSSHYKLAAGLEKLYANNFSWRVEYLHNSDVDSVGIGGLHGSAGGGDGDYGALGLGWEFSPLLTGSLLSLANFGDDSGLISANLLYSLTNESELSVVLSIPFGGSSDASTDGSSFGDLPRSALIEYRLYF